MIININYSLFFSDSTAFLNQHEYRMLCKNGSLAIHTGFNVDTNCAWSVTIDSEVNNIF